MHRLFLCWGIIWILIAGPSSSFALHEGQDKEAVIREIGEPNGKRDLAEGELWVYSGNITLFFEEGRLVRVKGTDLMPPPVVPRNEAVQPAPRAAPVERRSPTSSTTPKQETETTETPAASEDEALLRMADSISNPESYKQAVAELESQYQEPPSSATWVGTILSWIVPTLLQWAFLIIAFRWVGAEALKSVLLLIAVVDRLIILGVQWIFYSLLAYPTTFHAESLLSFVVMLGMVNTMTHARQLPTAIKVVVASKVAGIIATYIFILLVLHNL